MSPPLQNRTVQVKKTMIENKSSSEEAIVIRKHENPLGYLKETPDNNSVDISDTKKHNHEQLYMIEINLHMKQYQQI